MSGGSITFNESTRRLIQDKSLWYATPNSFNDPFDCNMKLHVDDSKNEDWEGYLQKAIENYGDPAGRLKHFMANKTWDKVPWNKDGDGSTFDTHHNKSSVLCLSKKNNSIPMFSYYADEHKGFCAEFTFGIEQVPCGFEFNDRNARGTPYAGKIIFKDVIYQDNYPDLNYHRNYGNPALVDKLIFTKHADWRHEKEYRIFRRGVAAATVTYPDEMLTGIVFGCRATSTDIDTVKTWLACRTTPVTIYRATQTEKSYDLEIEQIDLI